MKIKLINDQGFLNYSDDQRCVSKRILITCSILSSILIVGIIIAVFVTIFVGRSKW